MKINVVGTSGSGKSTLARRLATTLSLPYLEMDALYWRPGWQATPDDAFAAALAKRLDDLPGWVLDGNYDRTRPIKWRDVDWVIWVDSGFVPTIAQSVSRTLHRAWTRQELWPGTGNRESFRQSFFSRHSVILWAIKTWRRNRLRYLADMRDERYRHIRFVRLRSRAETEDFLRSLTH